MNSSRLKRTLKGFSSFIGMLLFPIGWWWCRRIDHLATPERLDRGCVFVLSGIQGKSPVEFGVARGLEDGDVDLGIVIFEWTTGLWPLFLFHLRASFWHRRMAMKLVKAIVDYQTEYPDRPVFIVGHSGGAGLALMATAELPEKHHIRGVILLAPAVSSTFHLQPALEKTEAGIVNFHSTLDCLFLGIGTLAAGTMDGRHIPSAGMIGFLNFDPRDCSQPKLQQIGYRLKMLSRWNFGGHFGCINRLFIADYVAPWIVSRCHSKLSQTRSATRSAE